MYIIKYSEFKNHADRCAAFLSIILLSPIVLVIMSMIRLLLGSPIFFIQQRPGRNGKPFNLIKFRTMTELRNSSGKLCSDRERMTKLGLWLRSTSLDELPALINILRGEMSFIGPRPLLMSYLPLYSSEQSRRHCVRPGFSGLAQINGRNTLSWEEKFKIDVFYVDNQCLWLDLKIFVITIYKVIRREGVNAIGEVTMPPFIGSKINH